MISIAVASIAISVMSVGISTWSMVSTYRSYQWLRWRVTRLGIVGAREDLSWYRATGETHTVRNVFAGSYKRRYRRAYVRTLQAKEQR